MSDTEKPAFHVVDRRRSAQPTETTTSADPAVPSDHADSDEGVPADTSSATNDANPVATPQTHEITPPETSFPQPENDSTSEPPSGEEQAGEPMAMPDPASLLGYVALQMDVKGLAATLLGVFAAQAWRAMGLIAHPATGQIEKNMPEAQIAIDCVQFLLSKVENDLDVAERREIQRRLNDLRMNYVAKMRE